jgi:hypothetical protein
MRRIAHASVLVFAVLSLLSVASSTATAVTWHNSGSTTYTATGGGTTLSNPTNVNLICTSSTFTGTATSGTFSGSIYPAASGTGAFNGCTVLGVSATTHCTFQMTAVSWTAGPPSVTSGSADVLCTSFVSGSLNCITEGSTAVSYTNPSGATKGNGTAPTSSTLKMTNGASACMLGNNIPVTISTTPLTITAANFDGMGPRITRTP